MKKRKSVSIREVARTLKVAPSTVNIDYRPIVAELRKRKYDGFWTTEYEDPSDVVEGTRDDLASLLALLGRKA